MHYESVLWTENANCQVSAGYTKVCVIFCSLRRRTIGYEKLYCILKKNAIDMIKKARFAT